MTICLGLGRARIGRFDHRSQNGQLDHKHVKARCPQCTVLPRHSGHTTGTPKVKEYGKASTCDTKQTGQGVDCPCRENFPFLQHQASHNVTIQSGLLGTFSNDIRCWFSESRNQNVGSCIQHSRGLPSSVHDDLGYPPIRMLSTPCNPAYHVSMQSSLFPRFSNREVSLWKGWTQNNTTTQSVVSFHQKSTEKNARDACFVASKGLIYQGSCRPEITRRINQVPVYSLFTTATLLSRRFMPHIRLMRAGDIESNPGPRDSYDRQFLDLCKHIPPSSYTDFGISLGFGHAELSTVREKRQLDTFEAQMDILCRWRDRQPPGTDILGVLAEKLRESRLDSLVELITPNIQPSGSSSSASSLTVEQVEQIKNELKEHYRQTRNLVLVDPLETNIRVQLNEIYTNLSLIDQSTMTNTPIKYEDLLTRNKDERFTKRILLEGEGGVGKTTLCSKIALDWCDEKILQDLDMVIVIPLRDVSVGTTIGGIVKQYVSDTNEVSEKEINHYISKNLGKILLVFDGFDEFSEEMKLKSSSEVIRILGFEQYKLCKVIVTTRPWRKREFTMNTSLAQTYTFVKVEGFNWVNVENYIERYFRLRENNHLAEELINFMSENDEIWSNMAPFPIFCAMLCLMWKDISEEERRDILKLQTFSQIFGSMIAFLKNHYTLKESDNLENQGTYNFDEATNAIEDIGEIALNGLLTRTLSFPEQQFDTCRNSMLTCCRVGVLTRETNINSRERRRDVNIPLSVESRVSFPHKLFQEYIAGLYIKTVFEEDQSKYYKLKNELLRRHEEFRYLLYFSSHMKKGLGLDVIDGLVKIAEQEFCVDVAFECHTEEASKAVGSKWEKCYFTYDMSAHTISGMSFMVKCNQAKSLLIEDVECGRTLSLELAEGMCSSSVLRSAEIHHTPFHNDFYTILAAEAPKCQITDLEFSDDTEYDAEVPSPYGRSLAQWLCTLPSLSRLNVAIREGLPEEFFSTAVALASSCKIHELKLCLGGHILSTRETSDLAEFLCRMPHLKRADLNCRSCASETFFTTLASSGTSCGLQSITFNGNPANEFLGSNQRGVTQSDSDSGSPVRNRRRKAGHGSRQESSPPPWQPELSRGQGAVSREDQEKQEESNPEEEQDE